MVTNSKEEFFTQLKYELNRIGIDQTDEIFQDFEEHFADSALSGESEEETARNLGDVAEIARNYLDLESCRINSMVARDIERKKKVSLTKPGKSVPADLNLLNADELKKSDCVREYTPEHFSEEIYPNSSAVNSSVNTGDTKAESGTSQKIPGSSQENAGSSDNSAAGNPGAESVSGDVADALSAAGKAVADAAKITGKAIAEAFEQSNVKEAVSNAGKSAAEAMRSAGKSASDAVRKAKEDYEKSKANNSAPHPSNDYRENIHNSRKSDIPDIKVEIELNKGFKFSDVKDLEPNLNAGKLVKAILLDLFLWIWLVPLIISCIVGIIGAGIGVAYRCGLFGMWGGAYSQYVFISRMIGGVAFISLGAIIILIGASLIKPVIHLIKHIIMLHIKAVYDL